MAELIELVSLAASLPRSEIFFAIPLPVAATSSAKSFFPRSTHYQPSNSRPQSVV